jgi:hypothetical protein
MPVAFAAGGDHPASKSASLTKQIKQLKQRVAALEARPSLPSGPAGGDLTGSYPNPQITAGAVNSAKVADGSLTGLDIGKAAGVTAINFGSIAAGSCAGSAVNPGVDPDGEAIVITPSQEIDDNGKLAISVQDSNVAGFFVVNACNVTGTAIDPPSANFSWVVLNT